ncbi:MAG: hypothetical protein ACI35O_02475 [Bacillaceae bacterium]
MSKTVKEDTKVCSQCKKAKKLSEYYMASSTLINADGKLCICSSCLVSIVDYEDRTSVKNILRMIDRPFLINDYIESPDSNKVNPFREYMRRLGMRQNREKTWLDSDFGGTDDNLNSEDLNSMKVELEFEQDENVSLPELIKFFGRGFETEDYYWLNDEYEDFLNRYECDSKGMELLIKEICLTQLDIKKRRAKNEKVDQQLKTLQDLLGSSNLKPVQETGANAVDQESFGTLIKKYENDRPVPEPDPKWKDVDSIGKYIRVFFLGHLSRMLGIKNDYENEYWEEINKFTVEEPVNEEGIEDGRL